MTACLQAALRRAVSIKFQSFQLVMANEANKLKQACASTANRHQRCAPAAAFASAADDRDAIDCMPADLNSVSIRVHCSRTRFVTVCVRFVFSSQFVAQAHDGGGGAYVYQFICFICHDELKRLEFNAHHPPQRRRQTRRHQLVLLQP